VVDNLLKSVDNLLITSKKMLISLSGMLKTAKAKTPKTSPDRAF
jgi:hypothetical protein